MDKDGVVDNGYQLKAYQEDDQHQPHRFFINIILKILFI